MARPYLKASMTEHVSNTINQLREMHGITQQELATAVGVTRQTIISIEKGKYQPSVMLALKIARYFKKPLETIFSYEQ